MKRKMDNYGGGRPKKPPLFGASPKFSNSAVLDLAPQDSALELLIRVAESLGLIQSPSPPSSPPPSRRPDEKMKGKANSLCSVKEISSFPPPRNGHQERGEPSRVFCSICDDAKPPNAMKRGTDCRHVYCHECIREYVRGEIKEDIHGIKCPDSDCKKNLCMEFCLDSSDSKELVETWVNAKRECEALAKLCIIRCPFKDCSRTFLDDRKDFLIKACPFCWKLFCRDCEVKWHMGMDCGEYKWSLHMRTVLRLHQVIGRVRRVLINGLSFHK
ncbi:unnamed protein product [Cuscuta epithymum]|uniref:Uncharacterized protein n=1 Tax=Cuscuta epithymum TaxID=186058 RepID=A0AAV0FPF5_9ASTE|nr:unnamed protein product [Cuscuta epithymum]